MSMFDLNKYWAGVIIYEGPDPEKVLKLGLLLILRHDAISNCLDITPDHLSRF